MMVLSEVAQRLMMMSGSGASTCPAECGRAATSRLTEVATTTVPAGHCWPVENRARISQVRSGRLCVTPIERCSVNPDAVEDHGDLRAMATFALLIPIRLASLIPQTLREDHFFVR